MNNDDPPDAPLLDLDIEMIVPHRANRLSNVIIAVEFIEQEVISSADGTQSA